MTQDWRVSKDVAQAELGVNELLIIVYAIRELRAGTDDWEFPTLVGASIEEADRLTQEAENALRRITKAE